MVVRPPKKHESRTKARSGHEHMNTRRRIGTPIYGAVKARRVFNAQVFLDSAGVAKTIVKYGRGEAVFTQGDVCKHVMYIQTGGVKLSVLSKTGKEAVVAILGPGEFFGEGCLAGQPVRMASAMGDDAEHDPHQQLPAARGSTGLNRVHECAHPHRNLGIGEMTVRDAAEDQAGVRRAGVSQLARPARRGVNC